MKKFTLLPMVAALLFGFTGLLHAEGGPPRDGKGPGGGGKHHRCHGAHHKAGGHLKHMIAQKDKLGLNEEQVKKLTELMEKNMKDGQKVHEAHREARKNLMDSAHSETLNEKAIKKAAKDLGKAIINMAKFRAKCHEKVKDILTEDQLAKVKKMHAEMKAKRQENGPRHGRGGSEGSKGQRKGKRAEGSKGSKAQK